MFNRFFDTVEAPREMPARIYALIDQQAGDRLLLEAIDADWYDRMLQDGGGQLWLDRARSAPLAIVNMPPNTYGHWGLYPTGGRDEDAGVARDWLQIELDGRGDDATIHLGLFAEGVPIGIAGVALAPEEVTADLEAAFDLSPHVVTKDAMVDALGALSQPIEWVAVYDVGQGSANALCDRFSMPRAYFDLGGGVLGNRPSFSASFTDICYTLDPMVILSHWDWDHWSSGSRFPRAAAMTWIAPLQKLGAVHSAFAASIVAAGRLLIWPTGLAGLSVGQVTIEKCTGTSGRNSTGLAMFVDGPHGEKPILITGDARYSAIPSGLAECHAVVVPHHGANMRLRATPVSTGHAASRAAYSYGGGNSFGHPCTKTYADHHANAWPHRYLTGVSPVDRHTADLRPQLGHIGIGWSSTQPLPTLPCRGRRCSLALAQR